MSDRTSMALPGISAQLNLKPYSAELPLGTLAVGVDNIHHDVFLSPSFVETTEAYLLEYIRQAANLTFLSQTDRMQLDRRQSVRREAERRPRVPEAAAWKKQLSDLLHAGLQRAKYEKNIEIDLLFRAAMMKFLTQEIGTQFANLLLEAKEWIRGRGVHFDATEQGHVIKARLAELQADRRNLFRKTGLHVYQAIQDIEENTLGKSRKALFGDEALASYDIVNDRLAFVEGGRDDVLFLEQYVLLGNYQRDQDRFENVDTIFIDFLKQSVSSGAAQGGKPGGSGHEHGKVAVSAEAYRAEVQRLQEEHQTLSRKLERSESLIGRVGLGGDPATLRASLSDVEMRLQHAARKLNEANSRVEASRGAADFLVQQMEEQLGEYLSLPENARRLFDPAAPGEPRGEAAEQRSRFLSDLIVRFEQRGLLEHILASYQLRNICHDYCPPIHLQQLKKALVSRDELKRVEEILKQFPTRQYSLSRIEELCKKIRKTPREEVRAVVIKFAEDFMRLRRDMRNYERLSAAMERITLVRNERTRELSEMNHTLYEFVLAEEARPAEDRVLSHTIIKADVRGSTKITQELLARGLNPASLFSLNFYEPVKRILDRYGAAKVFIEGDALVLAIYETESNREQQRAVSKACALARQILAVSTAYNERPDAVDLPRLELGVGIAFQGSPPTYWMDTDSRIMISRALNLSDRLSSCSKAARRMLSRNPSPFRLFLFQTMTEGVAEDEADEFLIRFNLNGVELNDEGFDKLREEIALTPVEVNCIMPWGKERVTIFHGETPVGEGLEPVLIRRGYVRQLLPGGKIGEAGSRPYYEVCVNPKVGQLVEYLTTAGAQA